MKVILLAGGFGTRLVEYTEKIPKPMVTIGERPILWHIMNTYAKYGHRDFYIALGYKAEIIKEYFLHYRNLNADFTVDLANGNVITHQAEEIDWRVTLVHTGLETMTGGRVKRMRDFIGKETFLLTYGDGVSDINLNELVAFHKSHGKMITITGVHPGARFGELEVTGSIVTSFKEKTQTKQDWVNGGYFVIEPDFFELIADDQTVLEKEPLIRAVELGELRMFEHRGYWQCMDTLRDRDHLENLWRSGEAPWRTG